MENLAVIIMLWVGVIGATIGTFLSVGLQEGMEVGFVGFLFATVLTLVIK